MIQKIKKRKKRIDSTLNIDFIITLTTKQELMKSTGAYIPVLFLLSGVFAELERKGGDHYGRGAKNSSVGKQSLYGIRRFTGH